MKFEYSEELIGYMNKSKKRNIIVEVATSDGSDFEVSELHIHFVSDKQADLFVKRQHFTKIETEYGYVLLPPYRLEYGSVIQFGLRKFGPIYWIAYKGVQL